MEPAEPGVGKYVPKCDGHGGYLRIQCHSGTPYCWCVDNYGKDVPNTQSSSKPYCGHTGKGLLSGFYYFYYLVM